jgi:hypothetical protein
VTGARRRSDWVPETTIAWNVSFSPANRSGQLMTAVRFPLNEIQVPALAFEHTTSLVRFQQRTTVLPERTCSRIFAASALPARSFTTTVYRHGVSATGFVELVDIVARIGSGTAAETAVVTVSAKRTTSSRTSSS